ncbi:MAG: hypothetical protein ACRDJ9_29515 [Dehalococcoidia bacterium]
MPATHPLEAYTTTPTIAATGTVECRECGESVVGAVRGAYGELYSAAAVRLDGLAEALAGVLTAEPPPTDVRAILAWAVEDWLGHDPAALVAAVRHRLSEGAS